MLKPAVYIPGDLVVRRGAETKRLRVPMGRFDDLENGGGAADALFTGAPLASAGAGVLGAWGLGAWGLSH